MSATAALCNSFKLELLAMTPHRASDVYKVALYTDAAATLGKSTTAYSTLGEVSGLGYVAGGIPLVGFSVTLDIDTAILDWTTDPVWPTATITADTALIYNATREDKAVGVIRLPSASSTNAPWTLELPLPAAHAGLVRLM